MPTTIYLNVARCSFIFLDTFQEDPFFESAPFLGFVPLYGFKIMLAQAFGLYQDVNDFLDVGQLLDRLSFQKLFVFFADLGDQTLNIIIFIKCSGSAGFSGFPNDFRNLVPNLTSLL